jgi:CubicO group peptidase (beta-lactamase class C family)
VWSDPDREIVTPNVAGGLHTSADNLFAILQSLAGQGEVRLLSDASISTMESDLTSGLVQTFRPVSVADDWSYGLGLWCEHTAADGCSSVSSAGAYGTYPWVDRETGTYGVVVTLGNVLQVMPHARRLRAMAGSLGALEP